jgi:adenylate cyclase
MSNNVRFPLRAKLALLALGLTAVPLPSLGVVLVGLADAAIERELQELHLAVVDDLGASVTRDLDDAEDGLETVGRLLFDASLTEDEAIAAAIRVVEGEATLDHVAIYGSGGALVDVIRESGLDDVTPPETLDEEAIAEARDRGVHFGAPRGEGAVPRVPLLLPILREGASEPSAYARSEVSLAALQTRVERIGARRFGDLRRPILVVDAAGRALAGAPFEPLAHPLLDGAGGEAPFAVAFARQGRFTDGGEATFGTLASLPRFGWAAIVQVPEAVAFASVRRMREVLFTVAAVVALLAALAGVAFATQLVRPLRTLAELAERLGRREWGSQVRVKSNDELALVGDALSQASVELADSEETIRREQAIRADLGRYLPAQVVERVVEREQDMGLGGVRRTVTVLFADVVRFTPLTEQHPPEVVVEVLNELFTILTELVFRNGGTVDKFIGDCVMAMWGAPDASDDHAARALTTAEEMLAWLETGNVNWQERYGIRIELAIGVHTGEAVVGNVGSSSRMAYTAIGDVVNLAARLESVARPMQILTTEATREAAGNTFDFMAAGEREIGTGGRRVTLYEVRS